MAMEKKVSLKDSLKEQRDRVMTAPIDPELENRMVHWIEEMTGDTRGTLTTAKWLKNGKILCNLLNRVQPNAVKIRRSLVPTDKLENIQKFIGVAKGLGVPVFDPFDLYDGTDLDKVLQCVEALQEVAPKELPVVPQTSGMGQQLSISIDAKMLSSTGDVHDTNAPDNDDAGDGATKAGDKGLKPLVPDRFLPSTGNFAGPVGASGGLIMIGSQRKQTQAKQVDAAPPLQQGAPSALVPGKVSIDNVGSKPRAEQDNVAGNCCASCVLQ